MIPIEKSNPVAVEKICLELYKKMNFSKYKDFKRDLKEWVQKNIPELGSEDDVFIKIMTADYHLLQKYKDIGKSENFSKKEEKISKYVFDYEKSGFNLLLDIVKELDQNEVKEKDNKLKDGTGKVRKE